MEHFIALRSSLDKIIGVVSLNNSFLVLGSSLNYYRDFSSLSLTPYLVQNDFDIDQIKIYQEKHKVLILDVLSKLRENLYNIDADVDPSTS